MQLLRINLKDSTNAIIILYVSILLSSHFQSYLEQRLLPIFPQHAGKQGHWEQEGQPALDLKAPAANNLLASLTKWVRGIHTLTSLKSSICLGVGHTNHRELV